MCKNIIQQARGRGGPTYRAPSFKYKAEVKYLAGVTDGIIKDFGKWLGINEEIDKYLKKDQINPLEIAVSLIKQGDYLTFLPD